MISPSTYTSSLPIALPQALSPLPAAADEIDFGALLTSQPVAEAKLTKPSTPLPDAIPVADAPIEIRAADADLVWPVATQMLKEPPQTMPDRPSDPLISGDGEEHLQPTADAPAKFVDVPAQIPPPFVDLPAVPPLPPQKLVAQPKSRMRSDDLDGDADGMRAKAAVSMVSAQDRSVVIAEKVTAKLAVQTEAKPAAAAPFAITLPEPGPAPLIPPPVRQPDLVIATAQTADAVLMTTERVLDVARGNMWLDQLAREIVAVQDDTGELSFRLMPAQLGQLDVRVETQDGGLQLNFSAQNSEAAQIVAAAQPRLIEELRGQGVRVAGSDVGASSDQQASGGQSHHHAYPSRQERSAKQTTHNAAPAQSGRFA